MNGLNSRMRNASPFITTENISNNMSWSPSYLCPRFACIRNCAASKPNRNWCSGSSCREHNSRVMLSMSDWCFSQSQLSACSKALESSEELLELANQTLCSSETDGFTQVSDRPLCCCCNGCCTVSPCSLFRTEFLMIRGEFLCGVMLPVILTQMPATCFCVKCQHDGLQLSFLFAPYLFSPFSFSLSASPGGQRH